MSEAFFKNQQIKQVVLGEVRQMLRATAGQNPDLSKVIVWLRQFNDVNNVVTLGLALGTATGCNPFCGCAAQETVEVIEELMKEKLPFIRKVAGKAKVPSKKILAEWNNSTDPH